MGLLYPGLPIAICIAFFGLLGKHALDMKGKKNYREMWGALSLSVLPAALFLLWAASNERSMATRNIILMPMGAILGAFTFAWGGYVIHDWMAKVQNKPLTPPAEAQSDDAIYQAGTVVGMVYGGRRIPNDATRFEFQEITNCAQFNTRSPFTYAGVKMIFENEKTSAAMVAGRPDSPIRFGVIAPRPIQAVGHGSSRGSVAPRWHY